MDVAIESGSTPTAVIANELSPIQRVELVYVALENVITHEAKNFSEKSKAHLRRSQGQLQKLRLSLLDSRVAAPNEKVHECGRLDEQRLEILKQTREVCGLLKDNIDSLNLVRLQSLRTIRESNKLCKMMRISPGTGI